MKTIYDMTSGTLRKEVEDNTCDKLVADINTSARQAECRLQAYIFENVPVESVNTHTWLSDMDINQFITRMKQAIC